MDVRVADYQDYQTAKKAIKKLHSEARGLTAPEYINHRGVQYVRVDMVRKDLDKIIKILER